MRPESKRGSAAPAVKASSPPSTAKGKQATQEQLRLAEITSGHGDRSAGEVDSLIQQVVDLTGKSVDEASVALHDCDFNPDAAVQHLFDTETDQAGEWTTCKSRKAKSTTHFNMFEQPRRRGRGAENGGFSRARGDDDRTLFRGRGSSRGRGGGGRGFGRGGGRGRSADSSSDSFSGSGSGWGKPGTTSNDATHAAPAKSSSSGGWADDAKTTTSGGGWGSDPVPETPHSSEPAAEPSHSAWATEQTSASTTTDSVSVDQLQLLDEPVAEIFEEIPIEAENRETESDEGIDSLSEENDSVVVRNGCIIGAATRSEAHHLLFPNTLICDQACRIRRSQIPSVPVEMPGSSQITLNLGIVFGSVPTSSDAQPIASSPGFLEERHDFADRSHVATSEQSEILSLSPSAPNIALLRQQSPMTSAHLGIGSMVTMTTSSASSSQHQTGAFDRHLPTSSDFSQAAAAAADMSALNHNTPGSAASHHSTPGAATGSTVMDMVSAAHSSSDPVMGSPLASQQPAVSSRLLESGTSAAMPMEGSPKPQLSPAAVPMSVNPPAPSAGSAHNSPVVGSARAPPPLAMPPSAASVTTAAVSSVPPGVAAPTGTASSSSTTQKSLHKTIPPGMMPNNPPYLPNYMARDASAQTYQGDSKYAVDQSSSTSSAMGQAGQAGGPGALNQIYQQQMLAAAYYGVFPGAGFMMPQLPYGHLYGGYPPAGIPNKGHYPPGAGYLPQFAAGMTGTYEDEYGKGYQSSSSQSQGKTSSTSVSYSSASGSGLAGSGYKNQYDGGKSAYQNSSSAGLFSMPPVPVTGQGAAGMPSYGLPGGHAQAMMMPPNLPPSQGANIGQALHSHQGSSYHHGMIDSSVASTSHIPPGSQSSRGTNVSQHLHGNQQSKHHSIGSKQYPGYQG